MKNKRSRENNRSGRFRAALRLRHALGSSGRRVSRTGFAALMALALAATFVGLAARAQAPAQGQVGPINPDTGFPFWYEDVNGLRLELCLDNTPQCLTTLPDPARQALVAADAANSNFPDEAFWFAADASIDAPNGVSGSLVLASEAAFANDIKAGDQVSFGRVRIRLTNLEEGATYRVTHPYGVDIFENVAGGDRGVNFTEDIGITKFPQGFLDSRIKPFLTWDTFGVAASAIPEGDAAPPAGFIGDPTVDHKVKGSPILDAAGHPQNYFRIEKIDPISRQVIETVGETDLFALQGKLAGLAVVPSPRGGTFGTPQSVSLVATDPNAIIFYTTDGTDPKDNISTLSYDGTPITVGINSDGLNAPETTLRFFAIDQSGNTTTTATEVYTIVAGTPQAPPVIATASLKEPGPIDPNTGYPMWYEDLNGLRLDLCVDNNGLCLTTLPDPNKPALVAADAAESNFPDESFWFAADAGIDLNNGGRALLVLASEAAFAQDIKAGDQIAFGRVRIRIDNLEAGGTYRVTHPYGVDVFENVAGGDRGINYTEDIGVTEFPRGMMKSRIGPFLTWDTFGVNPASIPAGDAAPPAGYIGDPNVEHRVKGSPLNQNFFRIEKLDPVTKAVVEVVGETDLFAVQGKLAVLSVVPSLRSGSYAGTPALSLVASDATAKVYYTMTTNGTTPGNPTAAGRIAYTGPITLAAVEGRTTKLKFVAEVTNAAGTVTRSAVVSETYTSDNVAPTVAANPAGGLFDRAQSVSLIASEASTVFYTTNGSDPSNAANVERVRFSQPISVIRNTTIKFAARDLAGNMSAVVTQTYTIDDVAPNAPTIPDLAAASDDGASNTDNVTSDFTPTFIGTAEAGSTVKIFIDGVEMGSGIAGSNGAFSVTTSALTAGTHSVTARAIDAANNVSVLSGALSISITGTAVPSAPSDLVASIQNVQNGQARLTWNDNSNNETSFVIERSASATSGFTPIATVGANTRTFLDTSVGRKVLRFWRVRAINSAGSSAYSNTASVTTN